MSKIPNWLKKILEIDETFEGKKFLFKGYELFIKDDIIRSNNLLKKSQKQTEEAFFFKWKKTETYESKASLKRMHEWLISKYGDVPKASWLKEHGKNPLILDAGCGAGMSGLEFFAPILNEIKYLGVDVSNSVDIAKKRFEEKGYEVGFIQCDLNQIPLPNKSVDIIFSEGVLHHTDSTEKAIKSLSKLIKSGGRFLFYVYKKKGPIREFSDDYIREQVSNLSYENAWKSLEPLTQLGIDLGKLNIELDIKKPIDIIGVPKGKISIQRLFYWHVAKIFYREDLSFDEMNHINFDWYMPSNASRHTFEEIKNWCEQAHLIIEKTVVEDAGITIISRKM